MVGTTRETVFRAYRRLKREFGGQGWWPLLDENGRLAYHRAGEKLTGREQLEVCVGALLTQNTSWKNVVPALQALQKKGWLNAEALSRAPQGELASTIRSAGYYNQKARKLKEFAQYLEQAGGLQALLSKPVEDARIELLAVWGVGPETADSMLLYAGGKPVFVVDAYTKRVVERLGWMKGINAGKAGSFRHYGSVQEFFHENAPKGFRHYKEFHALFVGLGKRYCTKNSPKCGGCPLRGQCTYGKKKLGLQKSEADVGFRHYDLA